MSKVTIEPSRAFPGEWDVWDEDRTCQGVHIFLWTAKRKAKRLSKKNKTIINSKARIVYENGVEILNEL